MAARKPRKTKAQKLEQVSNQTGKTMFFDEKAVEFLTKFKEKLKAKDINEVILTSFNLLQMMDEIHNTGGQLIFKTNKNELYPISLYDEEMNNKSLEKLEQASN